MNDMGRQDYQQGQHICAIYDTREEQVAVAAAYIADGLRKRERCLYVAESRRDLELFRERLKFEGVDVGAVQEARALVMLTTDRAHLVDGRFDCERMLTMLNDALEAALNEGHAGLRTCGDMSWLLANPPGAHQVVEYEAVLNEFFRNVRGLGMCQYDRSRLPAGLLDHAGLAGHSSVVVENCHKTNPYYGPASPSQPGDPSLEAKLTELTRG